VNVKRAQPASPKWRMKESLAAAAAFSNWFLTALGNSLELQ